MQIVLLGTAGYHSNDQRQTSCVMIPEFGLVLDAGTGFYRVRDYLQTSRLDVFISHAHIDHIVGLTYLFDVLLDRPEVEVAVHAEQDKLDAISNHLFAEPLFPVQPPCQFQVIKQETPLPDDGLLTYFPVKHPGGVIGFRLQWGDRSLAYVTDTTAHPEADYIRHIQNVNLLIHECHFQDGNSRHANLTGHSCTSDVARLAKDAGVECLVLVHINPLADQDDPVGLDRALRIHKNTLLGADRMVLDF